MNLDSEDELNLIYGYSRERLVVIKFGASWCGPCKKIKGDYHDNLPKEYTNVLFYQVESNPKTDSETDIEDIMSKFKVNGIPHFVFLKDGNVITEYTGSDMAKVREILDLYNSDK